MRSSLKNLIVELIFPPHCVSCKKEGVTLCQQCKTAMRMHNSTTCPQCKKRIPGTNPALWKCSTRHTNNPLSFVLHATTYESNAAQQLIRSLKYRGVTSLVPFIADTLRQAMIPYSFEKFICTSVPLANKKYRTRGFNQSALLAAMLSTLCNIPYQEVLLKIRDTKSQTELTFDERQNNIKNAFVINNKSAVKNKNILIIDDVFTSGATLQECARVLKYNGAKKVGAIVFAR